MSYLKFGKQDLVNLELSLNKELLRTSGSGAYSCTTLNGCNTRKHHGLLICPVPNLDKDPHVLLSSLDETIIQNETEFNLGIHKFDNEHYSPKGHKYIQEFECDIIPKLTYRVGNVILTKEKAFISGEDRLLIRYKLAKSSLAVKLRFKPLLAFRNYHKVCGENLNLNRNYKNIDNGISITLYSGYPELYMQFSKSVEFVPFPHWYNNIEYQKEQERGYTYKEDLYVPGYFEIDMKPSEVLVFSAALNPSNTKGLKQKFTAELKKRIPRTSFINCLLNSAQQFIITKNNRTDIKAGFPWLPIRGRDTFIALPGLAHAIGKSDIFIDTFKNIISDLNRYLNNGITPSNIEDYDVPDLLLWASWALQKLTDGAFVKFSDFESIYVKAIQHILIGNINGLTLHKNGLLYVDGSQKPPSWMNAMFKGTPSAYRSGYLIEFNALWYNSLCYYGDNCSKKCKLSETVKELISKIDVSFKFVFSLPNKAGLYDYVDPKSQAQSDSIRPNMLFAISLPYSPLDIEQQKKTLDVIERYLLTPRGLRSLAPNDLKFIGNLRGDECHRDKHYFNGTAWPWLLGSFTDAYLKIYKTSGHHFLATLIQEFESVMTTEGIGTISEYFYGNPPHEGDGAISSAINVAELLRTAIKLNTIKALKDTYS